MLPQRPRLLLALFVAICALLPASALAQREEPGAPAVDRIFARWNRTDSPGCVVGVGRAGEVLLERAYGMADLEHDVPLAPGSVLEIGSVSKQFVTAAVLLLAQEGKLALDDDVRRYVPQMPDFGHTITLRQMAQHLSGLRDHWELLSLQGSPPSTVVHTIPQVLDLLSRQQGLNFPPGEQYLYSNMGYIVLGTVVQRVSGKSLAEFSRDRFRRSGSTVEYQIQALPGGSILELRQVDQPDPVQAWVAVPAVTLTPAQLAEYAGSYYSPELEVTYEVVLEEGGLKLRHRLIEDRPLQPTFADAFATGGANLIFRRDAEGRVSGFGFYGGRIRDVRFERREG